MATPTSFPAFVTRSDGSVAQVNDLPSYNGAVQMGYFYPTQAVTAAVPGSPAHIIQAGAPIVPSAVVVSQPGGATTTIKQVKLNKEQDDGR